VCWTYRDLWILTAVFGAGCPQNKHVQHPQI
jgi:hypothetical protein